MEATIEVRQEWGHISQDISEYAGFVARPLCDEIGDTVWIRLKNEGDFLPYLVTDCAVMDDSDGALSWMLDNNVLVEFDYNSAKDLGILEHRQEIEMVKYD